MNICPENQCTGCGACKNTCKANAVYFSDANSGSPVAVIDKNRCTGCNMCKKVCPANNAADLHKPTDCYALWAKNSDEQIKSASAGAVSAFYEKVLNDNGIVFGTHFVNQKFIFDFAENKQDTKAFRGSRYLQAEVGNAYINAKSFLEKGKKVIFVGTPCQIAGLINFLKKPYDNLITVDLICHGVAPADYFYTYVKEIIGDAQYNNVEFRGKNGQRLAIYNSDGKAVYLKSKAQDLYYFAYAKGLIHRENCYQCKYSGINRCSDITVGDFWGLNTSTLKNKTLKTSTPSVCFVNTKKGNAFFNSVSQYIDFEKRTIEELLPYNKQLSAPCQPHNQRQLFLKNYKAYGFSRAVKSTDIGKSVRKAKINSAVSFPFRIARKALKTVIHHK